MINKNEIKLSVDAQGAAERFTTLDLGRPDNAESPASTINVPFTSGNKEINNTASKISLVNNLTTPLASLKERTQATTASVSLVECTSTSKDLVNKDKNKDMEKIEFTDSILMGYFMKKINKVTQPNSLTHTRGYFYKDSLKYKYTTISSHIYQLLNEFFGSFYYLIGKPTLSFTQKKLIISLNYYTPIINKKLVVRHLWRHKQMPSYSANGINLELHKLIKALSKYLKLRVQLKLNQLKYPFHDSLILGKLIGLNSNTRRFTSLMRLIIKKASVITRNIITDKNKEEFLSVVVGKKVIKLHKTMPTVLTGLKVKISGRQMTERVVPKRTVRKIEIGGFKKTKNSVVDYAMFTNKNKRGTYSVKVWTTSKILHRNK